MYISQNPAHMGTRSQAIDALTLLTYSQGPFEVTLAQPALRNRSDSRWGTAISKSRQTATGFEQFASCCCIQWYNKVVTEQTFFAFINHLAWGWFPVYHPHLPGLLMASQRKLFTSWTAIHAHQSRGLQLLRLLQSAPAHWTRKAYGHNLPTFAAHGLWADCGL